MWDLIFNWSELARQGADAISYFVMAAVGTILFAIRLIMALFFGDADVDMEVDVDADVHGGSDASFTLFSLLSVMAFIMGTGWMGLACRIDWGFGRVPSLLAAVGFGTAMMLLASGLMYMTRKLNRTVIYDVGTAVGRTGRVYLNIPGNGKGKGQVEVSVSGRRKILPAITHGKSLAAFTDVKVIEARDDDTLVVEPLE
jgi:hypothetical protein